MAIKTLVLGNSGTGKSASLRNFDPDEIAVINCAGKPLPFQNDFEQYTPSFKTLTEDIMKFLDQITKKVIVVDDAQYIMSFQYMRRIYENGWDKWNDIQSDFFKIIQICDYIDNNVTVYFLSHLDTDENGREKIKTMGKMLDEKIIIEGLFTTVLKTSVQDGRYYFITQNSGKDTVKSPMGMFDTFAIDNDLKFVDERIRNYYKIGEYVSDEKIAEMAEEVNAPEIEKPEPKKRGRKARNEIKKEAEQSEVAEEKSEAAEPAETEMIGNTVAEPAEPEKKPKRRRRKSREPETDETV
jgi:hypothetical protein